ncbi:MAG: type II toxin-antitoxin system prevent-host-death family antitoxin [Acidobacteria bacterium]|nr:MAG: type II toxin-antitoxin system prevent-host-death family antitoxin [Acidobacteriota bacterium]
MATKGTVGARELKNRLGKYLEQVRKGGTLIITDRGKEVAELRPLPSDPEEAAWERLHAEGTVTRPIGKLRPATPLRIPGVSLSDAIREDRDEGY